MVPESPGSFGSSSNAHLGMLGSILAEGLSREASPHGLYVCLEIHLDGQRAWLSCCTTP